MTMFLHLQCTARKKHVKQVYANITNKKHHQTFAQESNHICLKIRKSIIQSVDRGLFYSSENM